MEPTEDELDYDIEKKSLLHKDDHNKNDSGSKKANKLTTSIWWKIYVLFTSIIIIYLLYITHKNDIPFGEFAVTAPDSSTTSLTSSDSSTCDKSNIELSFADSDKSKLQINSLQKRLPGSQYFAYSYNQLKGKNAMDLIIEGEYRQILEFTYSKQQISTGTESYLTPDQMELPSITGICAKQSYSSSVVSTTSTSAMYSEASDSTEEESFDASVSASGWSMEGSASIAMSLTHSNSHASSLSASHASEGKNEFSYKFSKASLYSATMRWDKILNEDYKDDFVKAVGDIKSPKDFINIIGEYGSHVVQVGKMGARCREFTYFRSGMSSESYQRGSEASGSSSGSASGSASLSGSGFGFHASVSASFSTSSGSTYSQTAEHSGEASTSSESTTETVECIGEVYMTARCGEMLGQQNQPALVGYRMKPIWELKPFTEPYLNNPDEILGYVTDTFKGIMDAGQVCSIQHCGGVGICSSNHDFWYDYKAWKQGNYKDFWVADKCYTQYNIGQSILHYADTQIYECITSEDSDIVWDVRTEVHKIPHGKFCSGEDKYQHLTVLNSIQNSVHFSASVIYHNKRRAELYLEYKLEPETSYYTFETQTFNVQSCTNAGAVQFGVFCQDIPFVSVKNVIVEAPPTTSFGKRRMQSETELIPSPQPANNLNDSPRRLFGEELIAEYTSTVELVDNMESSLSDYSGDCKPNVMVFFSGLGHTTEHQQELTTFTVNIDATSVDDKKVKITYISGAGPKCPSQTPECLSKYGTYLKHVHVGVIHFCEHSNSIRYQKNIQFTAGADGNKYWIKRKYIHFVRPMSCSHNKIDIIVGFNNFETNGCKNYIWTEGVSKRGFTLILAVITNFKHTDGKSVIECANRDTFKVGVSYFALCV